MKMTNGFDTILDKCLDRVGRGESAESCLADYPQYAQELKPLLEAAMQFNCAVSFTPSADAKRQARQRLFNTIESGHKEPFWSGFLKKAPVWATAASVVLLLLVGLLSLDSVVPPGTPPTIVVSTPPIAGEGNFVFLVSDAPNDIGDFTSLMVTIDQVALLKKGDGDAWITFIPEIKEFDLTKFLGEASQELWRGNVPEGEYTKVEITVGMVNGTLKTGASIEIKLPSDKLQIGIPFVVGADKVTSFTFDITVNKTGQGSGKYILKPQAGDSGATYQNKQ